MTYTNIPQELRQRKQWAGAGSDKIPKNIITGVNAKSNDSTTWATFDAAIAALSYCNQYTHVAYALENDDDIVCIDLDKCYTADGVLNNEANAVYWLFPNTYTEISKSGNGLHIFCKGKTSLNGTVELGIGGYKIEVYAKRGRFIIMTGDIPEGRVAELTNCQSGLDALASMVTKTSVRITSKEKTSVTAKVLEMDGAVASEVIESALSAIPADNHDSWLKVAMALKWWAEEKDAEASAFALFDAWSRSCPAKYEEEECKRTWGSVGATNPSGESVTLGSLFHIAQTNNWEPPKTLFVDLPTVVISGKVPDLLNKSACTLGKLLDASGRVFNRGGSIVEIDETAGEEPQLTEVTKERACSLFAEYAALAAKKKDDQGKVFSEPVECSANGAAIIIAARVFKEQLKPIHTVSPCPVLVKSGTELVEVFGNRVVNGVYAAGAQTKTPANLESARKLLLDIVKDFNFVSAGDRSRALASLIAPALIFGGIMGGRMPVDLTEADLSQSGKGFRNKLVAAVYGQKVATVNCSKGGVGSIDEAFDTAVLKGRNFICMDNVRGKINSPKVESFLTEDRYSARQPYSRGVEVDPSRTIVMFTSNNAEMTPDLANRCSAVRITKQPYGYKFTEYQEGHILEHIRACQADYLGAVFLLVREWYARGCPVDQTAMTRHDFRRWAGAMNWIVVNLLGESDMFEDYHLIRDRLHSENLQWMREVIQVCITGCSESLRTADIVQRLLISRPELLSVKDPQVADHGLMNREIGRKLGRVFSDREEVQIDGVTVRRAEFIEKSQTGSGTHSAKIYTFMKKV